MLLPDTPAHTVSCVFSVILKLPCSSIRPVRGLSSLWLLRITACSSLCVLCCSFVLIRHLQPAAVTQMKNRLSKSLSSTSYLTAFSCCCRPSPWQQPTKITKMRAANTFFIQQSVHTYRTLCVYWTVYPLCIMWWDETTTSTSLLLLENNWLKASI